MINDKNIRKITIAKTPESFIVEWEYISPLRDDEGETKGGATECKTDIEALAMLCDPNMNFEKLAKETILIRHPDPDIETVENFVGRYKIKRTTVYNWAKLGKVELIKEGKFLFVKDLQPS